MSDQKKVIMQRPHSKKTISVGETSVPFLIRQGYKRAGTESPNGTGKLPAEEK